MRTVKHLYGEDLLSPRTIRSLRTNDGRRILARDAMLSAVNSGKRLALGTVWTGELKPEVDAKIDQLNSLVTPLTLGNINSAEEIGAVLNLGLVYTGAMLDKMTDAVRAATRDDSNAERFDLSEVISALQALEEGMEADDLTRIKAHVDNLRRVSDLAGKRRWAKDGTSAKPGLQRRKLFGDGSKPISPAAQQALNDKHWHRTTADARAPAVVSTLAAPRSIAEMNEVNRRFWPSQT